MEKIEGTLVYVSVNEPVTAYDKTKPKEWKASIVVTDEDFVDEFEEFAKKIDAKPSLKKVKSAEFEELFKCKTPEGAGKNVWVITLRKSTELGKTGKPVPDLYRPKVFQKVGKAVVEITNSKLVGNGSYGKISIDQFTRDNGTTSLYLKNVLVTELVEYVKSEGNADYNPGDEFGEELEDEAPEPAPAKRTNKEPAAKANKPATKTKQEEELEDPPF